MRSRGEFCVHPSKVIYRCVLDIRRDLRLRTEDRWWLILVSPSSLSNDVQESFRWSFSRSRRAWEVRRRYISERVCILWEARDWLRRSKASRDDDCSDRTWSLESVSMHLDEWHSVSERRHCRWIVSVRLHLSRWENKDFLNRDDRLSLENIDGTNRSNLVEFEDWRRESRTDHPYWCCQSSRSQDREHLSAVYRESSMNLLVGLESLELCHRWEKHRVQRDEHELFSTPPFLNVIPMNNGCSRIDRFVFTPHIRRIALIPSLIDHLSLSEDQCSWITSHGHTIALSTGLVESAIFRPGIDRRRIAFR